MGKHVRQLGVWRPVEGIAGLTAWQKDVPDGHLTVLYAREGGEFHMSISHRRESRSGIVPGRNPTWSEIKEARYRFCPGDVVMAMLLPPLTEYVNVHETTFHLWEIPPEGDPS